MARELLHGGDVGTSVEQIRNKRAPQVMGRASYHVSLRCTPSQEPQYDLIGEASRENAAAFVDGIEQGPRRLPTHCQPGRDRLRAAIRQNRPDRSFRPLPRRIRSSPVVGVKWSTSSATDLTTPKPRAVQEGEDRGVTPASGRSIPSADLEQARSSPLG